MALTERRYNMVYMNEVLNCLETRRSCRAYRPEQVPEEALQEILRAGLYAPSGMGR